MPRTADRRPSLTNRPPREEIVQLLSRREPIYRESAHLVVDTEGKSPEQLTDEILGWTFTRWTSELRGGKP